MYNHSFFTLKRAIPSEIALAIVKPIETDM